MSSVTSKGIYNKSRSMFIMQRYCHRIIWTAVILLYCEYCHKLENIIYNKMIAFQCLYVQHFFSVNCFVNCLFTPIIEKCSIEVVKDPQRNIVHSHQFGGWLVVVWQSFLSYVVSKTAINKRTYIVDWFLNYLVLLTVLYIFIYTFRYILDILKLLKVIFILF